MFVRPSWRPASEQDAIDLIDENPFALLICNGCEGPLATNLPLLRDTLQTDRVVLIGHIARANEQASALFQATEAVLAVFHGAASYVTASWYPGRDMPSTYYYTAVHCYGKIVLQDEQALDESLEDLTKRMERPIPDGWKTSEIPRSEITRRFRSIVGFRMQVERLEAKFKLGQDEPLKDALEVAHRLESRGLGTDGVLAEMIRAQNRSRTE